MPDGVLMESLIGGRWWSEDEDGIARAAFLEHGLHWFQHYSDVDSAIGFFRHGLERGLPIPVAGILLKIADRLLGWHWRIAGARRFPPIYHYYLSLLYFEKNELAKACEHLRLNREIFQRSRHSGEPQRSLRQFERMGCDRQQTVSKTVSRAAGRRRLPGA